jgi:hypothetical protein
MGGVTFFFISLAVTHSDAGAAATDSIDSGGAAFSSPQLNLI